MSISGVSGLTTQLSEYLTQLQEKQQEALAVNDVASNTDEASTLLSTVSTDSVTISSLGYAKSQNMLASNFVGGKTTDSTYVDAQMSAFSVQQSVENSMNDSLESNLESVIGDAAFWYGDPRMRNAKMMKDATEAHQEVFAELKGNIEQKAAEAMAPKDENGDPIEDGTTSTAAESVPTDAVQTPDAGVGHDEVAQAAEAVSSASDAGVGRDAAEAAAISITV